MNRNVRIYTITGVGPEGSDRTRCFGYYLDVNEAIQDTVENVCDINEAGYYPFVVIEGYSQGIHAQAEGACWFVFDPETDTYGPTEAPRGIAYLGETPDKIRVCNFALG